MAGLGAVSAAARDELATECAETYPRVVHQLVDLFQRMEKCDEEVSCDGTIRMTRECQVRICEGLGVKPG